MIVVPLPRISDLVCPVCGYQYETVEEVDDCDHS